jgi:hypothetical protein
LSALKASSYLCLSVPKCGNLDEAAATVWTAPHIIVGTAIRIIIARIVYREKIIGRL